MADGLRYDRRLGETWRDYVARCAPPGHQTASLLTYDDLVAEYERLDDEACACAAHDALLTAGVPGG